MDRRSISRRAFAQAAMLAASATALPRLHAQSRPEKVRVGIAVSGRADLHFLPLTLAEHLGFFRAEGLEVEVIEGPVGSADVFSGTYDQVISLQARGQYWRAFVLQGRTPAVAMGLPTRLLPDLRHLADLRGRRIGVSAPGSVSHLMASLMLSRAGLTAADVSYVGVGSLPLAAGALRSGQVDALCHFDPVLTLLEQRSELRIIGDSRTLKGTEQVFGGPMPAACLYAPQDFLQRYPATCQALAHAVVHALKWLQTAGPRDLLMAVPESHLLGDRALYLACVEKLRESISPDGILDASGTRTALRALSSFDAAVRPERVDLARTFTNEYARRAKERFRA